MKSKIHIPVAEANIGPREIRYVTDAVTSTWVSSIGKYITRLEKDFSKYCGRKYGQALSSGTTALHVALLAFDIGKGDEVIVPNFAFIAVANAVSYTGAMPVFVDIETDTLNIDPLKIEQKITKRTKAIIMVHTYGHACDIEKIMSIAKKHKLKVIEDAAEAHGTLYKGKPCGSFGDISCFSFYGNKLITTGEGGMCLTNDGKLYRKIRILRGQGMSENRRYWHEIIGYNYRMTNLEAALGCAQLGRIDELLKKKRVIAAHYLKLLGNTKGITLPIQKPYSKNSWWMFTIILNKELNREKVAKKLLDRGIETRRAFYPLSHLPPYKRKDGSLRVSEDRATRALTLPSGTTLKKTDVERVCNELKRIISDLRQ